jgi:leader peptidase (prepilin peptidase)/N-methyltransferase
MWRDLRGDVGGLGPYLLQTDFFCYHAWLELRPFLWTLLGSAFLFLCFFVLHSLFRGRALGGGDVKLAFLVGLITGFPNMVVAVFSAFLTGALFSIILVMLKKKKFGETVPFGPFLVAGTYIAIFWGSDIIEWYLGLL